MDDPTMEEEGAIIEDNETVISNEIGESETEQISKCEEHRESDTCVCVSAESDTNNEHAAYNEGDDNGEIISESEAEDSDGHCESYDLLLTPSDRDVTEVVCNNEADCSDNAKEALDTSMESLPFEFIKRTYNPLLSGCRKVDFFKKLNRISEGQYGAVYRAKDKEHDEIVALKHVKYHEKLFKEGFPITALREMSLLLELSHPNIIDVKEVVVGKATDQVFMVMEYVEHELRYLLEANKPEFSNAERKCLLVQLLRAIEYMHHNWTIHRDLKTSNLLYSNKGALKVCDFGMARRFGDPIKPYTHNVVTVWYRAPELLLGQKEYTAAVDMWSVGCIFGELILREPMFKGKSELDMLERIFALCGTPTEETWPEFKRLPLISKSGLKFKNTDASWRSKFAAPNTPCAGRTSLSDLGLDLLKRFLDTNPKTRISASEALRHDFLTAEKPAPQGIEFMPTLPDSNSTSRHARERSLNEEERRQRSDFHNVSNRFSSRVDPKRYILEMESHTQKEAKRFKTDNNHHHNHKK